MAENPKKKLKKMLSWSSDSSDDDENDSELKAIEKDVISNRRSDLRVVTEPQLLNRKVDTHRINPKFLRVREIYFYHSLASRTKHKVRETHS